MQEGETKRGSFNVLGSRRLSLALFAGHSEQRTARGACLLCFGPSERQLSQDCRSPRVRNCNLLDSGGSVDEN